MEIIYVCLLKDLVFHICTAVSTTHKIVSNQTPTDNFDCVVSLSYWKTCFYLFLKILVGYLWCSTVQHILLKFKCQPYLLLFWIWGTLFRRWQSNYSWYKESPSTKCLLWGEKSGLIFWAPLALGAGNYH